MDNTLVINDISKSENGSLNIEKKIIFLVYNHFLALSSHRFECNVRVMCNNKHSKTGPEESSDNSRQCQCSLRQRRQKYRDSSQ